MFYVRIWWSAAFPTPSTCCCCCAGQSFDDEGVVLADNLDEQRMQSLSPKVIVRDILPGVPDKANLSVLIDAEMLALSGIAENFEENVNVPRDTRFPIVLNILNLPTKRLRKECIFKLTKDFELFKMKVSRLQSTADISFVITYIFVIAALASKTSE